MLSKRAFTPIHRERNSIGSAGYPRRTRKLQFRAESFNLANRPNFDIPNNVANSATFGQVTTADAFGGKPPRQIQLGLRFVF